MMHENRTNAEQRQVRPSVVALFAAALLASGSAAGEERVSGPAMPCAKLAGLVQARGAAVISTGPHMYERLVRDQGFCKHEMTTAPAYLPSADARLCFAGYRCRPIERGEGQTGR